MIVNNQVVIPLPLTSMNVYSDAQRTHWTKGHKVKKNNTYICMMHVRKAMSEGTVFKTPCKLKFTWVVPNKKKDADNIASAKKFVLDGMQEAGLIKNDNLNHITGFEDIFIVDKSQKSVVIIEAIEISKTTN